MSVIYAPEERRVSIRQLIVPGILVLAFLGFVGRLWYWQVVKGEEYREEAKRAGREVSTTLAPRGRIYDRKGVVIADVEPRVVVTAKPAVVGRDPEVLQRVAAILDVDVKKLENAVYIQRNKGSLPAPIYVGAPMTRAAQIFENPDDFPGIDVTTQPMRVYRDGLNFSHVLGWVGVSTEEIDAALKERGIKPAAYVGRDGIEQTYEEQLMGEPGSKTYVVDLAKRPIRSLGDESPMPGDGLVLSLDTELQKMAHELLGENKGAVVALDPNTGEILCMASTPTYDVRMWEGGLSTDQASYLYQNPDRPLYKRAIAGLYPPGSTFKIVTTIAGELSGDIFELRTLRCPGYLQVGNRRVRCENHRAATMDYQFAFTKSCNSYFGKLAQMAGPETMREAMRMCGFGTVPDIDINGAKAGNVPTNEFVRQTHGRPWSLGDTNNIGIGQGDVLVSPLQMANLVAMVANRGVVYKPHVVRGYVNPLEEGVVNTVEREEMFRVQVNPDAWDRLQAAMENVVAGGTARAAQIQGISSAGKTGSAENPQYKETHAWYVGYAPFDNPQIAFAVVVEGAGHGGAIAAPIAKQIVEKYLFPERYAPVEEEPSEDGSSEDGSGGESLVAARG